LIAPPPTPLLPPSPPKVAWKLGLWNVRSLKKDATVLQINECMQRLELDVLFLT